MILPATAGPSAYWYLARGTGAVSLLLLTASVVLGILGPLRFSAPRWPRFALDSLHRDSSLVAVGVLVVHIVTSVLDGFAPISLLAGIVPFISPYRPLWLGLGAVAFDLMLAVALTSMVRRRLGYGAWRAVHWLAYACWPIAVLHGLGTGSDVKQWWMLALTVVCVAAVLAAVLARVAAARAHRPEVQAPAALSALLVTVGLAVFTLLGPLAPHWSRRAGTPARLLGASLVRSAAVVGGSSARSPAPARGHAVAVAPFQADLSGSIRQEQAAGGAIVDLSLRLTGGRRGRLRVRLAGAPAAGGGLSMTGSQVDMIVDGVPAVLAGQVNALNGVRFEARLRGSGVRPLEIRVALSIDNASGNVTGTLEAVPAGG